MKTKLVLWGTNAQDEKILIAMELRPQDNKVNIYSFPESIATEEFGQQMLQEWRNDSEVTFPEGHTTLERELTVTENLLPEDIRVERGDIIQRAQTEWHFIVLSTKLNELYKNELGDLKEKVDQLTEYSSDIWDELKGFWSKVQVQVKDRNLLRDHANNLRDNTNELFTRLKSLRASLDAEFQKVSQGYHDTFIASINDIEQRVNAGGGKLAAIFEELKNLQRKFRDSNLTREHRSLVWDKLDNAFKVVKEKRFGSNANNESSASDRLKRRYDGLINAIGKMQKSIDRDRSDLNFENQKVANSDGQLEAQIRQAKIKMIEERITSKEEKLSEMNDTKTELEGRMKSQAEKDAKREERKKIEDAKVAAKQKIASKIKEAESAREDKSDELTKAAEAIAVTKVAKAPKADTPKPAVKVATVVAAEEVKNGTALNELISDAAANASGIASVLDSKDAPKSSDEEE